MSYTETEAVKKLQDLDNSQVSVESTSQWFLSNKQMAKDLVKLWFKEFRKTSPKKKIAFLHLANDVIQRGITIAPQFRKLFEPVLPTAFKETSKVQRHSVRSSVAHLLIVWATRRVYSKSFLRQLRFICQRAVAEADTPDASEEIKRNIIAASPFAFSFTAVLANSSGSGNKEASAVNPLQTPKLTSNKANRKQRHRSSTIIQDISMAPLSFDAENYESSSSNMSRNPILAFREELDLALQTEATQPPKVSELIQLLESLQSAASADAATPSEQEQQALIERIGKCSSRLDVYNQLLEEETTKRNQLALQLRAFHSHLKERISQTKTEVDDLKSKLDHGQSLKSELNKHILNLPDLHLLPDMTNFGLDPLPTVGDLFG
ncbi:Regulation of nuclear pre-mRNA domain-containing protein 1A [Schistosoma japonicum]|nr:Regulation of nuclear pre-mRNA domain-containing protein 1A [Schistosoma japonicum]